MSTILRMLTSIDGWAIILWAILLVVTIRCVWSDRKNEDHTLVLVFSAPAILVFMAVYASVRSEDPWCFCWALAGIVLSAPIALIAVARLTAHYIAADMKESKQD